MSFFVFDGSVADANVIGGGTGGVLGYNEMHDSASPTTYFGVKLNVYSGNFAHNNSIIISGPTHSTDAGSVLAQVFLNSISGLGWIKFGDGRTVRNIRVLYEDGYRRSVCPPPSTGYKNGTTVDNDPETATNNTYDDLLAI
ncbi:MAG: hypothetical protein MO853_10170 [Candidatus Protistobacter heckmanni]|nr:hypothetical protein [Candidatus Protistobacter heckmanni]